jgi:hypothetical protein
LWTPIVGVLLAVIEIWIAASSAGQLWAAIVLAAVGAALGPGARSIDALLFGRKRLNI